MDLQKLGIKLYLDPATAPSDASVLVPVFQVWLQKGALKGLWIDAVDYSHVPEGPGAVLVGHEANLSYERGSQGPCLFFARKTPMEGSLADRALLVLRGAVQAAGLLEKENSLKPLLRFLASRLDLVVQDRLGAPNTDKTFQSMSADLEAFLGKILRGRKAVLRREADSQLPFAVHVTWTGMGSLGDLDLG